jgi:hypothetical protein
MRLHASLLCALLGCGFDFDAPFAGDVGAGGSSGTNGSAAGGSGGDGGAGGGSIASAYASVVLQDGPIAYWRFGETSGSVARDETGRWIAAARPRLRSA